MKTLRNLVDAGAHTDVAHPLLSNSQRSGSALRLSFGGRANSFLRRMLCAFQEARDAIAVTQLNRYESAKAQFGWLSKAQDARAIGGMIAADERP